MFLNLELVHDTVRSSRTRGALMAVVRSRKKRIRFIWVTSMRHVQRKKNENKTLRKHLDCSIVATKRIIFVFGG